MPIKPPPWSISYRDGSANAYQIVGDGDGARFEYLPITPAQSSTGSYSGGEPRTGRIEAVQVEALWQRVRELEADPSLRSELRAKGTGAFTLEDSAGKRELIIQMGPQLRAFDELLAKL